MSELRCLQAQIPKSSLYSGLYAICTRSLTFKDICQRVHDYSAEVRGDKRAGGQGFVPVLPELGGAGALGA